MPLIPAFQLRLNNTILPNLATVGKYDGRCPSLTCATSAGKIFVHSPHTSQKQPGDDDEESEVRFLNINQQITALVAGNISPLSSSSSSSTSFRRDSLFVGTPTNMLVYDVQENRDVFYKEVEDGVNAIVLGSVAAAAAAPGSDGSQQQLAIVGGQCNLQGFDHTGAEAFWSVTGDNITAMTMCDVDGDNRAELLVGSEDCDIRVFKGEEIVSELPESDVVCGLCPMKPGSSFGYCLANGTAGAYSSVSSASGPKRAWRVKSKNTPVCINGFDLDCDGVPELMIGWSSGRFEARSSDKGGVGGELIYKDQFSTSVAAMTSADYRMDGKQELIVCSTDGEVRGYVPTKPGAQGTLLDKNVMEETLVALNQRKQQLQFELKHFEEVAKQQLLAASSSAPSADQQGEKDEPQKKGGNNNKSASSKEQETEADTATASNSLNCKIKLATDSEAVQLILTAPGDLKIHAVVAFAEQAFSSNGGAQFTIPPEPAKEVTVPFSSPKNQPDDVSLRAFVSGAGGSTDQQQQQQQFLAMEFLLKMPKFAMFAPVPVASILLPPAAGSSSYVTFQLTERVARVWLWLKQSFILGDYSASSSASQEVMDVAFVSLRSETSTNNGQVKKKKRAQLRMIATQQDSKMTIVTDDIDLAGDIIQDLCEFLRITELDSTASFAADVVAFGEIVASVGEYNAARLKLTTEMADSSNLIKTLLIKAEDCRLLGDMRLMKQVFATLYEINRELVGEYKKRENNQGALMQVLKEMNQYIQKAARLRMGGPKNSIVASCREAVLANNVLNLASLLKIGSPSATK